MSEKQPTQFVTVVLESHKQIDLNGPMNEVRNALKIQGLLYVTDEKFLEQSSQHTATYIVPVDQSNLDNFQKELQALLSPKKISVVSVKTKSRPPHPKNVLLTIGREPEPPGLPTPDQDWTRAS